MLLTTEGKKCIYKCIYVPLKIALTVIMCIEYYFSIVLKNIGEREGRGRNSVQQPWVYGSMYLLGEEPHVFTMDVEDGEGEGESSLNLGLGIENLGR